MKKILMALFSAAVLFCGCSEENTEAPVIPDSIALSTDTILEGREGGTTEITVTSSGAWRLAGACDWARPSAVSGANGDAVVFTVDPNETYEDREETFKLFTGSAVATLRVVSAVGDILETESEEASVTIEHNHTTFSVKLHTNLSDLESSFSGDGAEWIEFDERIDAFGSTILRYKTKANPQYENRSCLLTIRGKDTDAVVEIPVTQRQIDVLEAKKTTYELDLSEQVIDVDISTNVPYSIRLSGNWISLVQGARAVNDSQLRFRIAKATDMRSGTITLLNSYNNEMRCEIKVIQNDPDAGNIRIPDEAFREWLLDRSRKWVVAASGDEYTVTPAGKAATSLNNDSPFSDYYKFSSLEGIEGFKNLTSISVYGNKLKRVDISKLTKVSALNVNFNGIEELVLGDNPVESISIPYHYHVASYSETAIPKQMKVSGTKLKTLDIVNGAYYDELLTLDISGCTALETLKAGNRKKLKTITMKTGQSVPTMEIPQGATIEYVD